MLFRTACLLLAASLLQGCAAPILLAGATAGGALIANDRRSAGTQLDDQTIELKGMSALAEDPALGKSDNAQVNVTSFNGIVLLTGAVRTDELRQRAGQQIGQVEKVRKVYNEVTVGEPAHLGARGNDSWLTTKVKTKLLANKELDGTRIKVVTDGEAVYLMGLVTRSESNIATAIASDTGGVRRIVRVFEYID